MRLKTATSLAFAAALLAAAAGAAETKENVHDRPGS